MKVSFTEEKILIDTYPEAPREELPMFAENRVHQRFSGNPYPNKVVLQAQRDTKIQKEYTLLKLENEFLEIGILPDLGGKIWYAKDKTNGYDFFYKNNVVKPALIGVLGSWTSGGVEFNWPFHHRASTFMPVDYLAEEDAHGITVWLSEHDPMDRMRGAVGVRLNDGECVFETMARVENCTPQRHSFLWWENAAVPVDKSYEIFFPEDVNYVHFHYKRSVTTYPVANTTRFGAFNGIYYDGDTDISKHKNTVHATSYFSASSEFDFFGGYNNDRKAGVVHVADHHISPGKKMFTWAYSQLAKTWENALTDNDGQYAELMASCYSDNQPDVTYLMPFETKKFSEFWFPIHDHGKPTVANSNGALFWNGAQLAFQAVRPFADLKIVVEQGRKKVFQAKVDLPTYALTELPAVEKRDGMKLTVWDGHIKVWEYAFVENRVREIPEPRKEYPAYKSLKTPEELLLLGEHMIQYRSPEYNGEACFKRAVELDPEFVPALVGIAECELGKQHFDEALEAIDRAEKVATKYNTRLPSGRLYYLKGLILLGRNEIDKAYDYFQKAAWMEDCIGAAMTLIGLIDLRRQDFPQAEAHFLRALEKNPGNSVAAAFYAFAPYAYGRKGPARKRLQRLIDQDGLNLFAVVLSCVAEKDASFFKEQVETDQTQVLLDVFAYMLLAGRKKDVVWMIDAVGEANLGAMASYVKAALTGKPASNPGNEGIAFPSRPFERRILEKCLKIDPKDAKAHYLLGCLTYANGFYREGVREFARAAELSGDYKAYRNMAVGYYSHLGDRAAAEKYMALALEKSPKDERQMTFERAYFLAKTGARPETILGMLAARDCNRDELVVETARAYNHLGDFDKALDVLLNRKFVACEGGEHYIADQYTFARYLKGKRFYEAGEFEKSLREFESAIELPQSLGSGFWNEIKKVPFQYFQAKCLLKLGRTDEAKEILRGFKRYLFDYFTDMYQYTFAYYLARALEILGESDAAKALMEKRTAEFEAARETEDTGCFGTTPFFISYIDEPKVARKANYSYPLYLFATVLKDEKRMKQYRAELDKDAYGTNMLDFTEG